MEDSLYVKAGREEFAGLVQIRTHSRVMLKQAPETFSGIQQPKREKSTGVIALMNMMQSDLQSDMKDAEADEKGAQKEYEDLMTDSAASRAQSAKSITDKEAMGVKSCSFGLYRGTIGTVGATGSIGIARTTGIAGTTQYSRSGSGFSSFGSKCSLSGSGFSLGVDLGT